MATTPAEREREAQQERLTALFDVALSLLALVFLALFLLEISATLQEPWATRITQWQLAIWVIFVAAFLIELTIAPSKRRYLRKHWLVALSLAIPLFRVFRVVQGLRVLRTTRALRSLNLARTLTTTNRALRSLANILRITQFAYLVLVTLVVTVVGASAVTFFERGATDSPITTFGEALWWASTIITTVGGPTDPVTLEGRVLGVILRIFGLVVFGYMTARLAVYFLGGGQHPARRQTAPDGSDGYAELRAEIARLTEAVEASSPRRMGPSSPPTPHRPDGRPRR